MEEVPNFCAKIKVESIERDDMIIGHKNAEHRQYPIAFPPIPKSMVKEEPTSEEDDDECQLIAYSPLPHGVIKEESEFEDGSHSEMPIQMQHNIPIMDQEARDCSVENIPISKGVVKKEPSSYGDDFDECVLIAYSPLPHGVIKEESDIVDAGQHNEFNPDGEVKLMPQLESRLNLGQVNHALDAQTRATLIPSVQSTADGNVIEIQRPSATTEAGQGDKTNVNTPCAFEDSTDCSKEPARLFKCKNCDRSYKRNSDLNRHLTDECGVEPKFRCKECGHRFSQKSSFKRHIMGIHKIGHSQLGAYGLEPNVRAVHPFKCGKCERTYKHKNGLAQHLKYECGVNPSYSCPLCNYRAAHNGQRRRHLILVHNVDRSQLANY